MQNLLSDAKRREIAAAFALAVNLTAAELELWLQTEASLSVGFKRRGDSESVGHRSGRRIVRLLAMHRTELDDDDIAHMRRTVGFLKRHLANRPAGDVSATRWRYSLMNWGHDPLKR